MTAEHYDDTKIHISKIDFPPFDCSNQTRITSVACISKIIIVIFCKKYFQADAV